MKHGYESISDFIFMEDEMGKADVILVAGGSKPQLALRAAELYKAGYSDYIAISGGENTKIAPVREYEFLSRIAKKAGVPSTAIIKEDRARNTVENAKFSYEACLKRGIDVKKAILVCKTTHSRRAYLTYKLNFPNDVEFLISPIIDDRNITKDNWIQDQTKIEKVMEEVEKIGKYFPDMIKELSG